MTINMRLFGSFIVLLFCTAALTACEGNEAVKTEAHGVEAGSDTEGDNEAENEAENEPMTTPDPVHFTDSVGIAPYTEVHSAMVQIQGIDQAIPVAISGEGSPQFRVCADFHCFHEVSGFASEDREIENQQYLQLKLTSSIDVSTTFRANIEISHLAETWEVTTADYSLACPSGYIHVRGDSNIEDFCVMTYEYKHEGGVTSSTAEGVPVGSMSRHGAVKVCSGQPGFSLITNQEWQLIARDLASVDSNWSQGRVGSGYMNVGHSDGDPDLPCDGREEFVAGDCANSGGETEWSQKRTHTLSNGNVIWDFSGNLFSWVNSWFHIVYSKSRYISTLAELQRDTGFWLNFGYPESVECEAPLEMPYCGFGYYRNTRDGESGALRGGSYLSVDQAGVFTAMTEVQPWLQGTVFGARCIFRPEAQ